MSKGHNSPLSLYSYFSFSTGTDVGSGDYGQSYNTNSYIKDEDSFDIDDSDYDVFIEEVNYPQTYKRKYCTYIKI